MTTKVVLIRGINVGGKNPVKMAGLREVLEDLGCTNVETLLVSGNAIVDGGPGDMAKQLESELPKRFTLHDEVVKVSCSPPRSSAPSWPTGRRGSGPIPTPTTRTSSS